MVVTRDLMHENQVLRGLLKSLSSFIGEGAGGIVNKLGWDQNDFDDLINKAETDTAWESYQRHKRAQSETAPNNSGSSSSQKRPAEDADPYGLRPKRARHGETNGDAPRSTDNFPLLVPLNPAVSSMGTNGLYPPGRSHDGSLLSDYGRGPSSSSPMFVPPSSPSVTQSNQFGSSSGSGMGMSFQSSYVPGMSMSNDPISSMSMVNTNLTTMGSSSRTPTTATPQQPADEEEIDPKKLDAYKLIQYVAHVRDGMKERLTVPCHVLFHSYHLENWKRNNNYCLPSSLRPTLVQR